jgi:5-methylcytosine-specific restriction protein A
MPYKPRPGCKYPYCPNKAIKGSSYCKGHKKLMEKQRPDSSARGYDYEWQKFREEYLKRNPFCIECIKNGKLTKSKVIDHIIPHKGDERLFWDEDNMQPLCINCHNRKTGKGL